MNKIEKKSHARLSWIKWKNIVHGELFCSLMQQVCRFFKKLQWSFFFVFLVHRRHSAVFSVALQSSRKVYLKLFFITFNWGYCHKELLRLYNFFFIHISPRKFSMMKVHEYRDLVRRQSNSVTYFHLSMEDLIYCSIIKRILT